jgi:hypothetical protein
MRTVWAPVGVVKRVAGSAPSRISSRRHRMPSPIRPPGPACHSSQREESRPARPACAPHRQGRRGDRAPSSSSREAQPREGVAGHGRSDELAEHDREADLDAVGQDRGERDALENLPVVADGPVGRQPLRRQAERLRRRAERGRHRPDDRGEPDQRQQDQQRAEHGAAGEPDHPRACVGGAVERGQLGNRPSHSAPTAWRARAAAA